MSYQVRQEQGRSSFVLAWGLFRHIKSAWLGRRVGGGRQCFWVQWPSRKGIAACLGRLVCDIFVGVVERFVVIVCCGYHVRDF